MIVTTFGQLRARDAQHVYQMANIVAEGMQASGKIPASAFEETFAKLVVDGCKKGGIPVSKRILKVAGNTSAQTVTGSVTQRAVSEVAKVGVNEVAKETGKTALRNGGPIAGAFVLVETGWHFIQFKRGRITKREFGKLSAESVAGGVGGWGGAAAGAAAGAAVGSLVPVIGTAIGCTVGGVLGGIGGGVGLRKLAGLAVR